MIYFDDSATTKPHSEVIKLYEKIASEYWYNPSSPHQLGLIVDDLYQQAQDLVKKALNLNKDKFIYFTKGGTEANNFAIYGICNSYLGQNKHIITTKIEHPSVLSCFEDLESKGFEVTYLDVNQDGLIDVKELCANLKNNTILVSIQWVNNIIGAIQPIKDIINLLKNNPRIKLHVDGIQGIGKVQMDFDLNEIDLFSISAHKIHGLKGSGILIYNSKLKLNALLKSIGTYPGTIDLPAVVACSKALQMAMDSQDENNRRVKKLHEYLKNEISKCNKIIINGSQNNYSPYLFNVSIKGKNSETVMHFLEQFGLIVATGSACGSKLNKPEPTILSISNDLAQAKSSIRISLSPNHSIEDLKQLVNHLIYFAQSS